MARGFKASADHRRVCVEATAFAAAWRVQYQPAIERLRADAWRWWHWVSTIP